MHRNHIKSGASKCIWSSKKFLGDIRKHARIHHEREFPQFTQNKSWLYTHALSWTHLQLFIHSCQQFQHNKAKKKLKWQTFFFLFSLSLLCFLINMLSHFILYSGKNLHYQKHKNRTSGNKSFFSYFGRN